MKTRIILSFAALALCLAASAQDLKPAKDKQTKKFGYQDKQKNWVIPPSFDDAKKFDDDGCALVKVDGLYGLIDGEGNWILQAQYDDIGKFDKNGLCELKIKSGKVKFYGVADRSGSIILPVAYHSVDIPRKGGCILASKEFNEPGLAGEPLWGVYDMKGKEVFPPRFLSKPSFSDGILIAKDSSGLYGVADIDGQELLPFDYLDISRYRGGFRTLGRNFTQTTYTADIKKAESFTQPGAVIPYDPKDDIVRAAAWRSGCIGIRLYPNQIRAVEIQPGYSMRRAMCREIGIDWGRGRFLRLEPFETTDTDETAMAWPSGNKYYTLKAMLYESDGTLVGEVTDCGTLEAECTEGVIYRAGGQETWLVLRDPNSLALPSYSLNLTGYRTIAHDTVYNGLGLTSYGLERLQNVRNYANRLIDIIEGENVGITSYLPPVIDLQDARRMNEVMRPEVFHHVFLMGEVVNYKVRDNADVMEIDLSDQLLCHFEDRFEDPYYSFRGDEIIYWGPHNARTVRLNLEPTFSKDAMADDIAGTGKSWSLVLSLFEEDGTWLRTIARAPFADYCKDGVILFRGPGIALLAPGAFKPGPDGARIIRVPKSEPLPHTISALNGFFKRPGGQGEPSDTSRGGNGRSAVHGEQQGRR